MQAWAIEIAHPFLQWSCITHSLLAFDYMKLSLVIWQSWRPFWKSRRPFWQSHRPFWQSRYLWFLSIQLMYYSK